MSFTFMLMQVEAGAPELVVITATDTTELVQTRRRLEAVEHDHAEMVAEMNATNKRFSTMNKELQDANEQCRQRRADADPGRIAGHE